MEWHPSYGFHNLVNQLEEGVVLGQIIKTQVINTRAVNIGILYINQYNLFGNTNATWLELKDTQKTSVYNKEF